MPLLIVLFWMLIFTCVHHHPAVVVAGRGRGMPLAAGDHHQQLRHVRALRDYYSHASASGRGMPLPAGPGGARLGPGHHHPAVVVAGRGMPLAAGDHHPQLRHVRALRDYYSDASGPGGYPKEGNYEANQNGDKHSNTAAEAHHSTSAGQVNNGGQGFTSNMLYAIGSVCLLLYILAYWYLNRHRFNITTQVPPAPPLVPSPPPPPPPMDLAPVLPTMEEV